jgi:MoxR-like ATPase
LLRDLFIWLLTWWHILLEWVPWIAKTLTIDTLARTLNLDFKRIQFTPDLLPADLIWTEIYNSSKSHFETIKWPIFTNFLLADEINRAPWKVQSALLEVMAEKQVTIWDKTYILDKPFIVFATQNPIEQSWTYRLPEAELDRFLLKVNVSYPSLDEEKEIIKNIYNIEWEKIQKIITREEVLELQELVKDVYVSQNIVDYIWDLVFSTRNPSLYWLEEIEKYLNYWVSPRWSLSLLKASQALAFLEWRNFVLPEDVKNIAVSALAHRLVLNYDARADDITEVDIINKILSKVSIS